MMTARQQDGDLVTTAQPRPLVGASAPAAIEHELDRAAERKDKFFAMIAHEMRNPLGPIRSAAALLARRHDAGPAVEQHAIAVIERQAAHLARLVDDLLDASRITHGKLRLDAVPMPLDAAIDAAVEANLEFAGTMQLRFRLAAARSGAWVLGDTVRLTQVFSNLLHNAAKFSFTGGTIDVDVVPDAAAGTVSVAVRDTGAGMSSGAIDTVFDLFAQEPHALVRSHGGLGIGLALVRELTELHGGRVVAHSDGIGLGSTFVVTLPMIAAHAVTLASRHARDEAVRRILVVDDNRDAAETLQALLACEGHEVAIAHTGHAAIARAAEFAPDLVLLDIGLPDIDGYEVAKRLRAASGGAPLSLVALTGYGRPEDERKVREAGFDHHL
ncbi:MAG TPA: hybrid sensor histidine kinase/response regulator, partial [Xanthomonadales bacterium]|nr:hybrid sensor histidine kinase/response regulator [Xanthomonadales bacterium]